MPKEKPMLELIPKIYKKNAEDIAMFFWVKAQMDVVPTITLAQAIKRFFKFTGITEWDLQGSVVTYLRMQKMYFDDCKCK